MPTPSTTPARFPTGDEILHSPRWRGWWTFGFGMCGVLGLVLSVKGYDKEVAAVVGAFALVGSTVGALLVAAGRQDPPKPILTP